MRWQRNPSVEVDRALGCGHSGETLPRIALAVFDGDAAPLIETIEDRTVDGYPGYAGFLGWILSAPLLLASPLAFLPALLAIIGLMIRTALEDKTLQAELPGYPAHASRVRYRLIPGLW